MIPREPPLPRQGRVGRASEEGHHRGPGISIPGPLHPSQEALLVWVALFFWTLGLVVEVSRVPDYGLAAWVDGVAYILVRAASRGWITYSIIGSKVPVGVARRRCLSSRCGGRCVANAIIVCPSRYASIRCKYAIGGSGRRLGSA